jgi:hypothetical protein
MNGVKKLCSYVYAKQNNVVVFLLNGNLMQVQFFRACLVRVLVDPGSYLGARLTWDRLTACDPVMFG